MKSIDVFQEQLNAIKNSSNLLDIETDLTQYGVTEEYFSKILSSVTLLYDFSYKYLHNSTLASKLSELTSLQKEDSVCLCMLIDVMRCYNGLNHSISFTTPEGIALLILLSKVYDIGHFELYIDLKYVDSKSLMLSNLLPYIDECSNELGKDCLIISSLLEKDNPEADIQYRKIIYKLCKNIAEVDGVILWEEKEHLEIIARLDDDDESNDIDVTSL